MRHVARRRRRDCFIPTHPFGFKTGILSLRKRNAIAAPPTMRKIRMKVTKIVLSFMLLLYVNKKILSRKKVDYPTILRRQSGVYFISAEPARRGSRDERGREGGGRRERRFLLPAVHPETG
jgi:hypothetical protein